MNKSMKPSAPAARQQMSTLTPEEKKEQFIRAYVQKKASLAEGILYNLLQNPNVSEIAEGNVVKMADSIATEFMKVVFHQELDITEDAE